MQQDYSITKLPNYSIVLPVSRFHQLPDFAFHQVAFQCADVADVELAVQVVGLVQKGAGQQLLARLFEYLSVNVLGANRDFVGTSHVLAEVGNAQASFTLGVAAFGMNDLGIDEDQLRLGVLLERDIDNRNAAPNADLRRGQPDAMGLVHRLEHIFDELLQFLVEDRHLFRRLLENSVAVLYDGIDHQRL